MSANKSPHLLIAGNAIDLQNKLWDGLEGEPAHIQNKRHWRVHHQSKRDARSPVIAFFVMVGPRDTPQVCMYVYICVCKECECAFCHGGTERYATGMYVCLYMCM
jgi:hypothetical protein